MRLLTLALVSACTTTAASEPPPDMPEPTPVPAPSAPWLASVHGAFYTRTDLSITQDAPDTTLLAYSQAPGATLVAVAEDANLPVLATLPGSSTQLASWYDTALRGNAIGLATVYAVAEGLQELPPQAMIESTLAIEGSSVHHDVTAIYFDVTNISDRFALATGAVTTATYTPDALGGTMTLAAHDIVIDLGDLAYQLADARTNHLLRQELGDLTQCQAVALSVAEQCGSCTSSVAAFDELCERGLDEILARTRAEIGTVKLHITGGSAALVDENRDASADHLQGSWQSSQGLVEFHSRAVRSTPREATDDH
jgi:hypothetical protein